MACVKLI
jgi:hypothetical protein